MTQTIDVADSVEVAVLETLHQQDSLQTLIDQSRMVALHRGAQAINSAERIYQDEHLYISVNPNTQRVWVSVYAPNGVALKLNDTNEDIDWTSVLDISDDGQPETMLTWVRLHNLEQTWVDHLQQLASGFPVRPEQPATNVWMLEAIAQWLVNLLQAAIDEHVTCKEALNEVASALKESRYWFASLLSSRISENSPSEIPHELQVVLSRDDLQQMHHLLTRLDLLLAANQTPVLVVATGG